MDLNAGVGRKSVRYLQHRLKGRCCLRIFHGVVEMIHVQVCC